MFKYNWHKKRHKDKVREMRKRAPHWLMYDHEIKVKELKNGYASVKIIKLDNHQTYYDNSYDCYRYALIIDLSWISRVFTIPYIYKPEFDILGQYDIESFITEILPFIPEEVFFPFSHKRIERLAYDYTSSVRELKKSHRKIRDEIRKERHWFSDMVRECSGRSNLHQDLKQVAKYYNAALQEDTSVERLSLLNQDLEIIDECDCDTCLEQFGQPVVLDIDYKIPYQAIEHLRDAEWLDGLLKRRYERWICTC